MTPPLLLITHNHREPILRKFGWATDVQVSRDGGEQRRSLRDTPTEILTYVMTVMNPVDSTTFIGVLANVIDMQVEFPRWEDTINLAADVLAGGDTLQLTNDIIGRHYEVGRRVLLYVKDKAPEITTVVTSANPIVVDPLVNDWKAGAMIVPLEVGRIESPVSGTDLGNFFRDPTVVMSVDEDIAGVGLDLGAQPLVASSLIIRQSYFNSGGNIPYGGVLMLYVDVYATDGTLIPNPVVNWSATGLSTVSVYPSGRNGNVILRHDGTGSGGTVDVTAEVDGVTTTATFGV